MKSPRELVSVEVIEDNTVVKHEHKWEKENLVTIVKGEYIYDIMKCSVCGITGKRYGLSSDVQRDSKYRAKIYDTCDGAIKKLNKINNYSINTIFCHGEYKLCINTNYIIKAKNESIANKEALEIENEISKYIKVFYSIGKRDIFVNVIENPYFNRASIIKYTFCDKTKTKKEFIDSLEDNYDGYFSIYKSNLIFESISYGISNCE